MNSSLCFKLLSWTWAIIYSIIQFFLWHPNKQTYAHKAFELHIFGCYLRKLNRANELWHSVCVCGWRADKYVVYEAVQTFTAQINNHFSAGCKSRALATTYDSLLVHLWSGVWKGISLFSGLDRFWTTGRLKRFHLNVYICVWNMNMNKWFGSNKTPSQERVFGHATCGLWSHEWELTTQNLLALAFVYQMQRNIRAFSKGVYLIENQRNITIASSWRMYWVDTFFLE